MPRTTESVTVSLPTADRRRLDRMRKKERRSRSAVVRDALLEYFIARCPKVDMTAEESAEYDRGLEEIARGEYVTLDELNASLASPSPKASRKATRKTAHR